MRRFLIASIIVSATILFGPTAGTGVREQDRQVPLAAVGEHPGDLIAMIEWVRGVEDYERQQQQAAEQAAMAATRQVASPAAVPQGDCAGIPAWFPTGIAWRESHCSYDAYNPGGCGGYGCIGLYQIDARHFTGWANGQSACGDLDPSISAGQDECAWRLSREGTNLAPWGG